MEVYPPVISFPRTRSCVLGGSSATPLRIPVVGYIQLAEKVSRLVILSEAKNLSSIEVSAKAAKERFFASLRMTTFQILCDL